MEILGTGSLLIPFRGNSADQIQIMPVVGIIHKFDDIQLKPNSNEVEKVFTVSIERLIDERYRRYTQYKSGRGYSTPVYTAGEERIWGLSAILSKYHITRHIKTNNYESLSAHLFLTALLPKEKYSRKIPYVQPYQMTRA